MLLNCGVEEDSWESLGLQGEQTSQSQTKSILNIHYKDWCWSWNSDNLAIWCEQPAHYKRPCSWERLKAGGEGDDRGWDGWMVSPTQGTWVWENSGSWWWTGKPGVLQSMESQRVRHFWATELNWTPFSFLKSYHFCQREWGPLTIQWPSLPSPSLTSYSLIGKKKESRTHTPKGKEKTLTPRLRWAVPGRPLQDFLYGAVTVAPSLHHLTNCDCEKNSCK